MSVKNLDKYQHYRNRNPPWVKLYYSILEDEDLIILDDKQKLYYILLILLASRTNNRISLDPIYLQRMFNVSEPVNITPLIEKGLMIATRKRRASKKLSKRVQPALLREQRTEIRVQRQRTEKEREKEEVKKITKEANPDKQDSLSPDGDDPPLVISVNQLRDLWNEHRGPMPRATIMTESRKKKIRMRLKENNCLLFWEETFKRMAASKFFSGNNSRNWKGTFDWVIENEENKVKVLENQYA